MLKHREAVEVPDFKAAVGTYLVGGIAITIYRGLSRTMEFAEKEIGWTHAQKHYRDLMHDTRLALPYSKVMAVVLGDVQNRWYTTCGFDIPAEVMSNQEKRMAEATTAAPETEATEAGEAAQGKAKGKDRITNKSIIEAGIIAGKSEEEILAEVKSHFPNGKADSKHVAYYRHFLQKAGTIPKPDKVKKEKKAKGDKTPAAAEGDAAEAAPVSPVQAEEIVQEQVQQEQGEIEVPAEVISETVAGSASETETETQTETGRVRRRSSATA